MTGRGWVLHAVATYGLPMIGEAENFDPDRTVWVQVYELIRGRIERGEYEERSALPSIYRLADDIGVAHGTVRKVIAILAEEHVVRPISGKGTFVRPRADWLDTV